MNENNIEDLSGYLFDEIQARMVASKVFELDQDYLADLIAEWAVGLLWKESVNITAGAPIPFLIPAEEKGPHCAIHTRRLCVEKRRGYVTRHAGMQSKRSS